MISIGRAVWADIQPAFGPWMASGLIDVRGGSFQMGHKDAYYESERIPHRVSVDDFRIGRSPVTNGEYEGWLKALGENRFFLLARVGKGPYPRVLARGDSGEKLHAIPMEKLSSQLRGIPSYTIGSFMASSYKFVQHHEVPDWGGVLRKPDDPDSAANVSWLSAFLFANSMGLRLPTEAEFARVQLIEFANEHRGVLVEVPDGGTENWKKNRVEDILGSENWQWIADRSDSYPKKPQHNPTGEWEWARGIDRGHEGTVWSENRLQRGGRIDKKLSQIQLANLRRPEREHNGSAFRLAADRPAVVPRWV